MIRLISTMSIFLFSSIVFSQTLNCKFFSETFPTNRDQALLTLTRDATKGESYIDWKPNGSGREYLIYVSWLGSSGTPKYHLQINDVIGRTQDGRPRNVGFFNGQIALVEDLNNVSGLIYRNDGRESIAWSCVETK